MNAVSCLDSFSALPLGVATSKQPSVVLVSVPGFEQGWSPLGIARLKGFLKARGYRADCLFLCVLFTDYLRRHAPDLIGIDAQTSEFGTCWHEIFYSGVLFGHRRPEDLLLDCIKDRHANVDIYRTYLNFDGGARHTPRAKAVAADVSRVKRYCRHLNGFLTRVLEETKWAAYDAIGFSCLDTQFLTSLYMARQIRLRCPKPRIIFGGEVFQSYNTTQFLEAFPDIDHIVVGQAEETLAALLAHISNGDTAPRLSGTMPDRGVYSYKRADSDRIDFFPTPNFKELRRHRKTKYSLTLNLGAGCSNSGCSFCPISSTGQHLRPPKMIVDDIRRLYATHGKRDIDFVDWEINGDPRHLKEVCDLLMKKRLKLSSWGELNARNTSPSLFLTMRRAGIRSVQIGIESFSERTLKVIGKRATLIDNIKVLKWGTEARMDGLLFNILCNHPLSNTDDATDNLRVLRLIGHLLRPPVCPILNEVSLYRTSRMYRQADRFNLGRLRQFNFYLRLYPVSHLGREIPMFCLNYDAMPIARQWNRVGAFLSKLKRGPVSLTARRLKDGMTLIHDSRGSRRRRFRLDALEGKVLWAAMEDTPTIPAIAASLGESEETIASLVARLIRRRLAVQSRGLLLSLPLAAGTKRAG